MGKYSMTIPQTLDEWREYLADSLKPLVTIGSTEEQCWFAQYQTGGRILEMREHLDTADWHRLLAERGITPFMEREYVMIFLTEARNYVNSQPS
jgi:hypothetical protein